MDHDAPRNIPGSRSDDELDERLEQALGACAPIPKPPDARASFAALRDRLGPPEVERPTPAQGIGKRSWWRPRGSVAIPPTWPRGVGGEARTAHPWPSVAWVTGAFAAGVLTAAVSLVAIRSTALRFGASLRGAHEYGAARGERKTVTLADGTQMALAPASRVRVPRDFGRRRRDLYLEGEGYFTVMHDAQHPFIVHAGNAIAKDVGTRFVVQSYPEDTVVRVIVADGKVSLGDTTGRRDQEPILTSGTLGEVDHAGVTRVTAGVNADDYVGWTRGEVRFSNTPLRDVLAELGRWYDLDISTKDSVLAAKRVTASFPTEPPADVLTSLAVAIGGRWQRVGRQVVFRAGGS